VVIEDGGDKPAKFIPTNVGRAIKEPSDGIEIPQAILELINNAPGPLGGGALEADFERLLAGGA